MSKKSKINFYDIFVAVLLLAFIFGPIVCVLSNASEGSVTKRSWIIGSAWVISFGSGFLYARLRCSSEKLPYWRGLKWSVAASSTGWTSSMVFMVPSCLFVFLASILIACYNGLRRRPDHAQEQFQRLIMFFYRNRMRQ